MEVKSPGFFGRIGERIFGSVGTLIALALIVVIVVAFWAMDPGTKSAIWQGIWRSIFWLIVVAAVPWSAKLFMSRMLEIGSNWTGVSTIAAFVIVDLCIGLILISGCDQTLADKQKARREPDPARQAALAEEKAAESDPSLVETAREIVTEGVADAVRSVLPGGGQPDEPSGPSAAQAQKPPDEQDAKPEEKSTSAWAWFAGLAALAVAGTYNYLVTEYLAEQAGG